MRYTMITLLGAALGWPLVGCDREVSHSERTTQNPVTGTTSTKPSSEMGRDTTSAKKKPRAAPSTAPISAVMTDS